MCGHRERRVSCFVCLIIFFSCANAQSPQAVTTEILFDSASAGYEDYSGWAGTIGDANDLVNLGSLYEQRDYLGLAEYAVNSATVQAEGKLGGPIAAGLTQGVLDIGDLVIAPYLAGKLVNAFPGVFIPAQTAKVVQPNPFGITPPGTSSHSSRAAPVGRSPIGNFTPEQTAHYSQAVVVPVHTTQVANVFGPAGTSKLYEIGVGPAKLINTFGGPVLIGEPALIGPIGMAAQFSGATQIGTAVQIGTASANAASASGPARSNSVAPVLSAPTSGIANEARHQHTTSVTQGTMTRSAAIESGPSPTTGPSAHAAANPGGILLTAAAAERLPLNLTLDGAYIQDGRIILTGRRSASSIDAALFLTAMRAACQDSDPYFSLDPDNMASWLAETSQAQNDLQQTLKDQTAWHFRKRIRRNAPSVLLFKTISASHDFPTLWGSLLRKYPDLKSRLVFKPEWLRESRFGEIMYRADVLLKELAGGATALGESRFRAETIEGYRSATERMAAKSLLYQYNHWPQEPHLQAGGRIWYDLTESSETIVGQAETVPPGGSELRSLLERRDLLATSDQQSPPQKILVGGSAIDLSEVYPRMFVRARDPTTLHDSGVRFPGLDGLVAQANKTPQVYATAYPEYRALVDVFRAYIVAVRAREAEPGTCAHLPSELLDTEKVSSPLAEYQPTDFTMTMGWYEFQDGNIRRAIGASGGLFQGGVSIGAAKFLRTFVQPAASTPIIHDLEQAVAAPIMTTSWKGDRGMQFIAFTLPTTGPPETSSRVASNTPVSSVDDSGWQGQDEIENAPAPRPLPPVAARNVSNNNVALLFVALLILGTLIIARPSRQRR